MVFPYKATWPLKLFLNFAPEFKKKKKKKHRGNIQ